MAGISDVPLRLTFSHSTLQGAGVRLVLTSWGWKTGLRTACAEISGGSVICLGSEKEGVCVLHLFFADLGWGGVTGFLLRRGTEGFLSKGFCLARLHHMSLARESSLFLEL